MWRALDELHKADAVAARLFRLVDCQEISLRKAARLVGLPYSQARETHARGRDFCAGYVTAYQAARVTAEADRG